MESAVRELTAAPARAPGYSLAELPEDTVARVTGKDWWNTASLEYVEGILAVNEPIILVGGGTREPDPEGNSGAGYREAGRTRYRFVSTKRFPLLISDDPGSQPR